MRATFESALRNANIADNCDNLYTSSLGPTPQVWGSISTTCQNPSPPATLPCAVRAGALESRALCCCESIAGQCQQALASNGCSVTTTTTTATWHIKGEIESCWTPGAYWVSFFNDVIFAMQDLDIWIKNLHRTAVAEARGSNFHVFYWWNFAEVRFAGFHDFVFYISYGFGKSVHILCGSFAEA